MSNVRPGGPGPEGTEPPDSRNPNEPVTITENLMRFTTYVVTVIAVLATASLAQAITTTGWTEYNPNPVYSPGKAYYPSILKEGSAYTLWSDYASSGGVEKVTSADGVNWTTAGACSGLTSPRHTVVEKVGSEYRMWYWQASHLYSIADIRTATSADGLAWSNDQVITQVASTVIDNSSSSNWNRGSYGPADVIYNPDGSDTIVEPVNEASVWANKFVMYYDGTTGGDESIGLAVSNDGVNWQGYNGGVAPVLAGTSGTDDWDEGYVSRCTVIMEDADTYHMWFSGGVGTMDAGIGYASSADGITWTRDATNPIFHKDDGEDWRSSRTYCPVVIGDEMWFTGKSGTGTYAMGYATPEPATLSLLALGGLALVRRRRT